jgi:hypothetical protein
MTYEETAHDMPISAASAFRILAEILGGGFTAKQVPYQMNDDQKADLKMTI